MSLENSKPVLPIYINECEEKIISNLAAGIEEEGILYEIIKINDNENLFKLAKNNVDSFMLESIIAVNKRNVYFLNSKYEKSLFKEENISMVKARVFGSNCARYIKGYPFKEVVE